MGCFMEKNIKIKTLGPKSEKIRTLGLHFEVGKEVKAKTVKFQPMGSKESYGTDDCGLVSPLGILQQHLESKERDLIKRINKKSLDK